MATKIVTKNSSTASAVPTASDLVQGELAVNVADKRLFTEDNAGAIVELGTNPSGNVTFQDNGKAIFGAGDDLQIYHDGSNSYINDAGTGNLYLRASNAIIMQSADGAETIASFHDDNLCRLYFDNAEKLATTSTGINVTGNLTMASGGSIVAGGANDLILNAGESGTPDIYLQSGSSTKVKIEGSSGNVGIGTSSPSRALATKSSSVTVANFESTSATAGFISFSDSNTTNDVTVRAGAVGDNLVLQAGGVERARIDSSGNLLMGKTSSNFGVAGVELRGSGEIIITRAGDVATLNRITSDGTLVRWRRQNVTVGSVSVTGSATSYLTSSDQRLKDNIADADDAGSKIDAIQVRKYDWKADGSHQDYGMIAQELQAVAPEAVSGDADSEDMMGVDYSKLVPMLVKEIQSLRNRVAQLEE